MAQVPCHLLDMHHTGPLRPSHLHRWAQHDDWWDAGDWVLLLHSLCRHPNFCASGSQNLASWQEVSKAMEGQGKGPTMQWEELSEGLESHVDVLGVIHGDALC